MEEETRSTAAKNAMILPVSHSDHLYHCVDGSTIVEQGVAVATPSAVTWELAVVGALGIPRIITTFNSVSIGRAIANLHCV
jgi:hypothetical protein